MRVPLRSRSAERLIEILLDLHLHGVVNRNMLMNKFKITERTVYRDLNTLAPFVSHIGDGQYQLTPSIVGTYKQELHISLADFLNADSFFPERKAEFWKLLGERIDNKHIIISGNNAEHSVKVDIFRYLNIIERAIKNNLVCQVVYKNKTRLIHPYKLVNHRHIWYMQATEDTKLKSFALSNINWLDITKDTFSVDHKTLNLIDENIDPWVCESSFDVKIFVKKNILSYFKRRDLMPGQEVISEDAHGATILCRAAHENQITPLILFWLPNIKVIEPSWLKDKIINSLNDYLTLERN